MDIEGNSVQNGIPTPENPVEIENGVKISIPIVTNQEMEQLDNNILNNYQTIYDEISKTVAKDKDIVILKRVIEYQHNELDKKDKIINEMANSMYLLDSMSEYGNTRQEVIDYFTKKVAKED